MNLINRLKNIPLWYTTIGELPTSFLESMTYAEQVTWLCNYMQKVVVEKINEITTKYNELITEYNNLAESFDTLNDNFDELEADFNTTVTTLNQDLADGLENIETTLSAQLPTIAETIISEKIQSGELSCQLGTSYNSTTEELTFSIQIVSGE